MNEIHAAYIILACGVTFFGGMVCGIVIGIVISARANALEIKKVLES